MHAPTFCTLELLSQLKSKKWRGATYNEVQNTFDLPSGKRTVCELENGPFIVDLPIRVVLFHSFLYVYQRVSPKIALQFTHFPHTLAPCREEYWLCLYADWTKFEQSRQDAGIGRLEWLSDCGEWLWCTSCTSEYQVGYPLVNVNKKLWKITIFHGKIHYKSMFNGKIHYFYGHFQ